MHDGSIASLAEVIDLYDRGGIDRPSRDNDIRPLNLQDGEKADLIAFLNTLNGTRKAYPIPPLPR
jgi:cytochrome c peroxidase